MTGLGLHILQTNLIVLLGLLVYVLFLRGSTLHQLNRGFLLCLPLFGLLLPMVDFAVPAVGVMEMKLPEILLGSGIQKAESTVASTPWFIIVWLAGVFIRLLISIRNLMRVQRRIEVAKGRSFTFLRHIHIEEGLLAEEKQKVMLHESVHARQLHSIDLIYLEFWRSVFWFNPAYSFIQRFLKEIHEFIADKEAHQQSEGYSELLLAKAFGMTELPLVNEFNNRETKNRIMMIHRKTKTTMHLKAAGAVLIFLTAGLLIACTSATPEPHTGRVYEKVDQMPVFSGCNAGTMQGDALKACSMEKLFGYVGETLVYPKELEKTGVSGKVSVQFVISDKGKVQHAQVIEGVHEQLDALALEMVEKMPDWTPGVHEGKKVKVRMVLPVTYALN